MKSTKIIIMVGILLIAGVGAAIYIDSVNKTELIKEGIYKLDVTGKVGYGSVGGWGISDVSTEVTKMTTADLTFLPAWWWDSGNVVVECILLYPNGYDSKKEYVDLGSFNTWNPISDFKPFAVTIPYIPSNGSPYTLIINVRESGATKISQTVTGIYIGAT